MSYLKPETMCHSEVPGFRFYSGCAIRDTGYLGSQIFCNRISHHASRIGFQVPPKFAKGRISLGLGRIRPKPCRGFGFRASDFGFSLGSDTLARIGPKSNRQLCCISVDRPQLAQFFAYLASLRLCSGHAWRDEEIPISRAKAQRTLSLEK